MRVLFLMICLLGLTGCSIILLLIVGWAATGPVFGYRDTWQLVINTGTTIVTFLMVCVPCGAPSAVDRRVDRRHYPREEGASVSLMLYR